MKHLTNRALRRRAAFSAGQAAGSLRRRAAFSAGQAAGSGAPHNLPPKSSFRARRLYIRGFNMSAFIEGILSRDVL